MNARRRPRMRRLIDNTIALVRSGDLSPVLAAQKLMENGVPVSVIGRVLGSAVSGDRTKVESTSDMPRVTAPDPVNSLAVIPPAVERKHPFKAQAGTPSAFAPLRG